MGQTSPCKRFPPPTVSSAFFFPAQNQNTVFHFKRDKALRFTEEKDKTKKKLARRNRQRFRLARQGSVSSVARRSRQTRAHIFPQKSSVATALKIAWLRNGAAKMTCCSTKYGPAPFLDKWWFIYLIIFYHFFHFFSFILEKFCLFVFFLLFLNSYHSFHFLSILFVLF